MNTFQFFSYVDSFCCCHKNIVGGQREKNLCSNEWRASIHKLSHSIKLKATLKKYAPSQDNKNAHSQRDPKVDSFYTAISDTIESAALTGIVKALSHSKGNRTRNWYFQCSVMKKPFNFPGGIAESH